MKVAFISRNTLFTGKGGDTVQIVKTAQYLRRLGVEVDIYTAAEKIDYDKYDILHGFNVIRPADLTGHFKKFKKLKVLSTIYVDYSEYEVRARGGMIGKVVSLIGSDNAEYLKTIIRRIRNGEKSFGFSYLLRGHRNSLKELIGLSDILLPNSESEYKRLYSKYGISKKHLVIPNAIDRAVFRHSDHKQHKQKNLVICVARIDGLKNQLNLIRALNNTKFQLILIGKPAPNHLSYFEQCKKEAAANISFIPAMEQEELVGYYQRAAVHAMPSWFETTGLSSLEAIAMGCNIVISDRGDQVEYFGDHACYAKPDDVMSIYEAVVKASEKKPDESFREKVFEEYCWEKTAEKTFFAYQQCLEDGKVQRKDILFVMQMPPPVHGVSVMNQLIKESEIINSAFNCHYIDLATARSIEDLQKARFRKYILTIRILLETLIKMLSRRYQYVYITIFPYGFSFIKDSCVVLLCKLFRLPHILHLHTYGFKKGSSRSTLYKKLYNYVFRSAEVICLSELLIEDIECIYKGKVLVLPNGIPQVNFENSYKKDQDPVTILFFSNLIKGKGILVLFDALQQLKSKGFSFLFRVGGSENEISYSDLQKIAEEKGLANVTTFIGPKFGEEKYAEFKNAGIFVLPTDYDTFGLVLLEAMQFGVPCISTNIGAIPDVLGNGRGVIIPEISPTALAWAIEDLLLNPEKRSAISHTAFEFFLKNYTSKIFEERLKNILNGSLDPVNKLVIIR